MEQFLHMLLPIKFKVVTNLIRITKNLLALLVLLSPSLLAAQVNEEWVPGEYIVKYNDLEVSKLREIPEISQYNEDEIKEALTNLVDASTIQDLPLVSATTISANNKQEININNAIDLINADLIEEISPNFIRKGDIVPNDADYSKLWGMSQANDIDINGPEAAEKATFTETGDIVVGVIDTGIDYTHPDLKDNMWVNTREANGSSGIDDDSNGVVDDIYGFNAINNSGNPMDDNKHGTHCAGTIGGRGNNSIGVAGVVWKVKLMALKFLSAQGSGSDSGAISAISYAINMKKNGVPLRVLSNSWGGSGYNPLLLDAIKQANDNGILFVAAAGNDNKNTDINANYPSCYDSPNVIAVAAINTDGTRASFSNYGATTVDVAAPGVNIYSTVPGGSYNYLSGTSMATPHVSGLAVLAYSQNMQLSPSEAKSMLMTNIKPLSALNGLMISAGIPNAASLASNILNHAPELQLINNKTIDPKIMKVAVPLVAFDKDQDNLTYNIKQDEPTLNTLAERLDKQYNFTTNLGSQNPTYWKIIRSASNETFYLSYQGYLYILTGGNLIYIATLSVDYFNNPALLINAYNESQYSTVNVSLIQSNPPYAEISAPNGIANYVSLTATVTDGDKTDSKQFRISFQDKGSCQ